MTRCFVVGNGPSLNKTDLDKLTGEVSFACNNIHLLYWRTKWRPTHYVRAEGANLANPEYFQESIEVHKALGCEMWLNGHFLSQEGGSIPGAHVIRSCSHNVKHYDSPECPHLLHLPMLCTFGSTVNVAVQIAMTLGYSPIYLVGCDLGYKNGQPNHFSPHYENGNEQPAHYANLDTLAAHMVASRSGYDIRNATVGGELEVYPRENFGALFPWT